MKIEFMNFKLNDREEFETYLNQKAQENYELYRFNELFVILKKSCLRKYYSVDYNPEMKLNAIAMLIKELKNKLSFMNRWDMNLLPAISILSCMLPRKKQRNCIQMKKSKKN